MPTHSTEQGARSKEQEASVCFCLERLFLNQGNKLIRCLFVDHRGRGLFIVIVIYTSAFGQKWYYVIHFDFSLIFTYTFFDPEFVGWISNPVTNIYHYLFANVHQHQGQIAVVPRKKPRTPLTFYCSFFQQQITLHTQHSVTSKVIMYKSRTRWAISKNTAD